MCKDLSPLELCCQLDSLICFAIFSPHRNVTLHRSKVEMSWHVHANRVNEMKVWEEGGGGTSPVSAIYQITGAMRNVLFRD